VEDVIKR